MATRAEKSVELDRGCALLGASRHRAMNSRWGRTFAVVFVSGMLALGVSPVTGQALPGMPPLPVFRALPGDVSESATIVASRFDGNAMMDGAELLKSTVTPLPGGPAGYGALSFPAEGAVSIYSSEGFDPRQGTIELWVLPGADPGRRRNLFSLSGAASFDGDGFAELFVGGASSDSSTTWSQLYFGEPGGLDSVAPALIETRIPRGVASGDINGDGFDDLVISSHLDGRVEWVAGPICPGRTYERPDDVRLLVEATWPQGLSLADLEGDGDLDLLVCSYDAANHPLFVYENDGTGGMTLLPTQFGGWLSPSEGLAVADFNRDGVLDVVFATLGRGLPSAVVLGSLDENGRYQLLVQDPSQRFPLADQALGVSVADLDGDGWQDIVLARVNAHELVIHMNRAGAFEPEPDRKINAFAPFTVCAERDLNNDGWLDIVLADFRQGSLSGIYSAVLFGPDYDEQAWFKVYSAVSFTIGDMNGDGLNDIFWRSGGSERSRAFYLNVNGETVGGQHVTTTPSHPSAYGAGVGVLALTTGGTSAYGATPARPGSFELSLEAGEIHFAVSDKQGQRHKVSARFQRPDEAQSLLALHGYIHVSAEWSAADGLLELRVGNPQLGKLTVARHDAGAPIETAPVSPVFRLGTDPDNQYAANGCAIAGVRISTVRRSVPADR
ncbi:MAG: hypothetical protein ACI9EF_001007 [Pseudohongiellaceae bacterium]|jgi:hypothetical protein